MKFGQYLEQHRFPPWRNEYIQYSQLKYFLKEQQLKPSGWTIQDENYFSEKLLIDELNKVNGFIYLKVKQIRSLIQQESEQDIRQKISDLINFTRLNATGFQKILKKHDKHTYTNLQLSARFCSISSQFDSHITNLNEILHSFPKIIELSNATAAAAEKITTTKYWVHPDNLTEVQALLLFYMPIVNKNASSTIYFDNPNHFPLYSNVLERNVSAETIRAKWYGLISDATDIYFEKKIHHESWLHNKGLFVKDRFSMKLPQANNYMAHGQCHGASSNELASSIYQSMHQQNLKSTLRCYHHRTTYQQGQSHFRVSLDTQVAFMKELGPTWRRNDIGESYPFDHLTKDEVYFFPYAVLETKFSGGDATSFTSTPEWLNQLVESQLVYEVPYFSKYLHGASYFYRKQLPMLPWWLSEMDVDIRRKSSHAAMLPSSEQGCTVVEPDYSPDYFTVAASGTALPKRSKEYDEEDDAYVDKEKIYSQRASSCTMIDNSHVQYMPNKRQLPEQEQLQQQQETAASAYDKFLNSSIMIKIKQITQDDDADTKKDEHHIGLLSWVYRKITNDQTLYTLPPQPKQQVMPKKGKLSNKKVEPKLFFSNERTFISWLQFSALLLSVSLGLVNFGDHISRGSGAFFIVVAILLAGYAQLRFQYRAWQIRFRGDSRFDDIYGPAVLCFVLVIALIVNLGLRVSQPLPTNPSLFSYNTTASNTTLVHGSHQIFPNGTMLNKHGKLVPVEEEDEDDPDEA
ncbi:VTC domain-containing protein [Parasitella parasitica]|nr:VTC domain-containing protein [Parasitella parasitica]